MKSFLKKVNKIQSTEIKHSYNESYDQRQLILIMNVLNWILNLKSSYNRNTWLESLLMDDKTLD